jgi:hypothetical protein
MKFYTLILLSLMLNLGVLNAQNNGVTKEESHEIDSIYQAFSYSYTVLNPELTANCYSINAVSIAHYDNQKPFILNGKQAILDDFSTFFKRIKDNKQTMTIQFKIIERTLNNNKIFDIGYYQLTFFKDEKEIEKSHGKVAIILVKDSNNTWKYETDTNSSCSELEFKNAKSL